MRFSIIAEDTEVEPKPIKPFKELSFIFDAESREFNSDPEYVKHFCKNRELYANELLKHDGWVCLADIYDMFDISMER